MILFKPSGVTIPQALLSEFYYAYTGQMYMINSDGVNRVTDTDPEAEALNVAEGELLVIVTSDIPCLLIGDYIYAQCGIMTDLAVHHEMRALEIISKHISNNGMANLLDKVLIPGRNGKWCIFKDGKWSIPESFLAHESGVYLAGELKKKSYTPSPTVSRQSPPQTPSAIGSKNSAHSTSYGGITFGGISGQRRDYIVRQSEIEMVRYAQTYVSQISIGCLQDFEFATTDVIMAVSNNCRTLMTPTPIQVEEFLLLNGTKNTQFSVVRMSLDSFQYDNILTLKKCKDVILTNAQRRFIISHLLRLSGLHEEEREIHREQLQTLSDHDLASQVGVEKSGYQDIKS